MASTPGKILIASQDNVCVLKLVGDIRVTLCSSLDNTIDRILGSNTHYRDVLINLMEAEGIDSTSLGLLAKLSLKVKQRYGFKPTIVSTNPSITKLLHGVGFSQIFNVLTSLDSNCLGAQCQEFHASNALDETQIKQKVIEAHRILMSLNQENQAAFRELVSNLEKN